MIYNDYNEDIFYTKSFQIFSTDWVQRNFTAICGNLYVLFFANEHSFLFPTLPTWCLLQLAMEKHLKKCVKWKVSNGKNTRTNM